MAPRQRSRRAPRSSATSAAAGAELGAAAAGTTFAVSSAAAAAATASVYGKLATLPEAPDVLAKLIALRILLVHRRIWRRRQEILREQIGRRNVTADALTRALAREERFERAFRRRSDERLQTAVRLALEAPDPSTRAVALDQAIRREQEFAEMRGHQQTRRVLASIHAEQTREISPSGALWVYGRTENHCVLCAFLAGRFWPWPVLDQLEQPLHYGCDCGLVSLGEGLSSAMMTLADVVPADRAAELAGPTIRQHQAAQAELERRVSEELSVRAQLAAAGADPNLLASLPLAVELPETEELEERQIWIKPYTRPGVTGTVAGYWRVVGALEDLANPRNPITQVSLPDGSSIRADTSRATPDDSFIIEHPDKPARRVIGTGTVAREFGATPGAEPRPGPDDTRQDVAKRDVLHDAQETFEERARGAVERFRGEPDAETQDVYGIREEEKGEGWLVTDRDRANFHTDYAEATQAGVLPPEDRRPRAVLILGGGATGKGTLRESGLIEELPDADDYALNDPDEAKVLTPEFQLMAGHDVPQEERWEGASARVHEQSGHMNDLSVALSRENGVDFAYDKVGGSGNFFRFADELLEADTHDVSIHVSTAPIDAAIARAVKRGKRSGRHVNEQAMREAHARVSRTWEQLTELGVPVTFWDNTEQGQPHTKIAEISPEGELTVHEPELWEAFKAKKDDDKVPEAEEGGARPTEPQEGEAAEVPAADFHAAIAPAIASKYGPFLSDYSVEEYGEMQTFLAHDGKVGGAIKTADDGTKEIVSLFNNGGPRGSGSEMAQQLIDNGATRLDNIGDKLRTTYERLGFHVTEEIPWDDQYAPANWDYEEFGRPPVYVMELGQPEAGKVLTSPEQKETPVETPTAAPAGAESDIGAPIVAPGDTPIPEGHVRLYHYTDAPIETIRQEGLDISKARGEEYGEPNLVWASAAVPNEDIKNFVEFSIPADDPRLQSGVGGPIKGQEKEWMESNYASARNVGLGGSVEPDEILAYHEPWMAGYRYLADEPTRSRVVAGEYDSFLTDDEANGRYRKAILRIKAEAAAGGAPAAPEARAPAAPEPTPAEPELPPLPESFQAAEPAEFPQGTIQHAFDDHDGHLILTDPDYDPEDEVTDPEDHWTPFEEWIYDVDPDDYLGYQDEVFNDDFWAGVGGPGSVTLYHGTTPANVEGIEAEGLKSSNLTRGITNRSTGPAVFASRDSSFAREYADTDEGGVLVEIDVGAMKADGLTPFVHGEEPVMESSSRESLAHGLGRDDFYDESSDFDGLSPETVVIREDIPAKYLKIIQLGAEE